MNWFDELHFVQILKRTHEQAAMTEAWLKTMYHGSTYGCFCYYVLMDVPIVCTNIYTCIDHNSDAAAAAHCPVHKP